MLIFFHIAYYRFCPDLLVFQGFGLGSVLYLDSILCLEIERAICLGIEPVSAVPENWPKGRNRRCSAVLHFLYWPVI